jgi:hypothetical protein
MDSISIKTAYGINGVRIISTLFILFLSLSCKVQTNHNSGVVYYKFRKFDPTKKTFVEDRVIPDVKVLYKDSLFIGALNHLDIDDSMGQSQVRVSVLHYTFGDITTKSFYDYKTFTDTAVILRSYKPDSTGAVKGGWKFYIPNNRMIMKNLVSMADTTIMGKMYKRFYGWDYKTDENIGWYRADRIAYAQCNLVNALFRVDNLLSNQIGCPVVRMDFMVNGVTNFYWELDYQPRKLTKKELQVFETWEKNAKNNPVHR